MNIERIIEAGTQIVLSFVIGFVISFIYQEHYTMHIKTFNLMKAFNESTVDALFNPALRPQYTLKPELEHIHKSKNLYILSNYVFKKE